MEVMESRVQRNNAKRDAEQEICYSTWNGFIKVEDMSKYLINCRMRWYN